MISEGNLAQSPSDVLLKPDMVILFSEEKGLGRNAYLITLIEMYLY